MDLGGGMAKKMKSEAAPLFVEQKITASRAMHAQLNRSQQSSVSFFQHAVVFITDEEEDLMLAESRINMAIKRNVLRDTFSDDLEYAYCIKNEHEEIDKLRHE
jgi:hypothetical protein